MNGPIRYVGLFHMMTTPDGVALADAEPRTVVLASDHDRVVAELKYEVKTLRLDAERYRWLRHMYYSGKSAYALVGRCETSGELDAAIDAAIDAALEGEK